LFVNSQTRASESQERQKAQTAEIRWRSLLENFVCSLDVL
jgi:hypothetical protein